MTGEKFLVSIRHLDCEINALELQKNRLGDQRQSLLDRVYPSGNMGVVVQHTTGSKTEALGVQLADLIPPDPDKLFEQHKALMAQINKKIDKLVALKEKAMELIEGLPNSRERALLIHRYLNNCSWAEVAQLLNYTDDYIRGELKDAAIEEFERVWKKNPQKPTDI